MVPGQPESICQTKQCGLHNLKEFAHTEMKRRCRSSICVYIGKCVLKDSTTFSNWGRNATVNRGCQRQINKLNHTMLGK